MTSLTACLVALYSALLDDYDTMDCFLVFHDTGADPNFIRYPDVNLRVSGHDAQSESQYATN